VEKQPELIGTEKQKKASNPELIIEGKVEEKRGRGRRKRQSTNITSVEPVR